MDLGPNDRPTFQDQRVVCPETVALSRSFTGKSGFVWSPNHIAPRSARRWSVVTFRAPSEPRTARAWNSSDVVTFWTPNTAGVFQAIGVVAIRETTRPAARRARASRDRARPFQAATNATATRTARA